MPVLSKPATSTALMTHALVEALTPIMPKGTLSLLCGSVGTLLDHIQWSDVIAFTGSADTGEKIRSHPQVLRSGVAINIEADSLANRDVRWQRRIVVLPSWLMPMANPNLCIVCMAVLPITVRVVVGLFKQRGKR